MAAKRFPSQPFREQKQVQSHWWTGTWQEPVDPIGGVPAPASGGFSLFFNLLCAILVVIHLGSPEMYQKGQEMRTHWI